MRPWSAKRTRLMAAAMWQGMLEFVDPELEWTYLNPAFENPEPETCHGRDQLQLALERQAERGLASQIEEIVASGDKVMVVIRTPGTGPAEVPSRSSAHRCSEPGGLHAATNAGRRDFRRCGSALGELRTPALVSRCVIVPRGRRSAHPRR